MDNLIKKKISPALFGIIIICFFLPFFTLSSKGETVKKICGFQSATGTNVKNELTRQTERVDSNNYAVIAIFAAAAGTVVGFARVKNSNIISSVLSLAGFLSLILFRGPINPKELLQHLEVKYNVGYILSLLLFLAALVYNTYVFYTENLKPDKSSF